MTMLNDDSMTMPVHPHSGLTALGFRKNGAPIFPIKGASEDGSQESTESTDGSTDPGDEQPPTEDTAKVFDEKYVKSLRDENARYRTQAKANAEKAKAYDEYVESQKTEAQKRDEEFARIQSERDELAVKLLRTSVAAKKNLPPSLASRLQGSTEEEMEADADALLADLKVTTKQTSTPEQTGAGVTGEAEGITPEGYVKTLAARGA